MPEPKLPWMPFYVNDFISSPWVLSVGLRRPEWGFWYVMLLSHQWTMGSLPDDLDELAALCLTSRDRFVEAWPRLKEKFQKTDGGRWVNPRMERERDARISTSLARAEAGRRGGKKSSRSRADKPGFSPAEASQKLDTETTTTTSKPENSTPVSELWKIWLDELGGTGKQPTLTTKRKEKLKALWAEHLADSENPVETFRKILKAIKASDHHMSQRAYQMPESTFVNEERRDRWAMQAGNPNTNGKHPKVSGRVLLS